MRCKNADRSSGLVTRLARGAFLIGDPATVAAKMRHASEALGGVSRITFQMSTASLDTAAMTRSIEFLGTEVAPIIRAAQAA